ncbi:MAG: hypothetical protein ABSA12_15265 [Verrucomicrobiia bacterium]
MTKANKSKTVRKRKVRARFSPCFLCGVPAASMPSTVREEAARLVEILKPYGASLTEAVEHYVETVLKFRNTPTVPEIVKAHLEAATKNGRRTRALKDLKSCLRRFSKAFPNRTLNSITLDELESFIGNEKLSFRARTQNKERISQLYNFAIRKGWASENLTKRLPAITPDDARRMKAFLETLAGTMVSR